MDTLIAYENHLGARLEFGGGSDVRALNYMEHGLRTALWSHDDLSGRVARFSRGMREAAFPVGIAASDGASGIELRNRIAAVTEPDVDAKEPGRFIVGDWSLECYVIGCEPTAYWMDDRFAEMKLTVLAERFEWVREIPYSFGSGAQQGAVTGNGEFPFDFPWEFARPRIAETIENDGLVACPFLWTAYGPVSNPHMIVGGNVYRVSCDVPDGVRLEVDSRRKTITIVYEDGSEESAFDGRLRGAVGSGSYIFERIPLGESALEWPADYDMDLVLYDVRSAPGWSR